MYEIKIERIEIDETESRLFWNFVHDEFTDYARQNDVELNFEEFCFAAKDDGGKILGAITGRAYYNEVHIGDLIVDRKCRKGGIGSRLVKSVEETFRGRGFKALTLTTFGFQAPEFYKKLGFEIEFVREDKDPKLVKYFLSKRLD